MQQCKSIRENSKQHASAGERSLARGASLYKIWQEPSQALQEGGGGAEGRFLQALEGLPVLLGGAQGLDRRACSL